ncbi:MAG: lipopolysaccharide kinase InaA family protein [Candidatus Accumulibacter sp.]|jgi:tRNA A-37 threonylcarbamoyl transferase component Bud32|nr:lipopolysaccharide kinase InaA family protein [Accumulibacter sp.]
MTAFPAESPLPCLSSDELARSGRGPATPFRARGADGEDIAVLRLLRVLPGKRLVGEARWRDRRVLVKLFVSRSGGRHWARERQGLALLREAGLPTPEVAGAGRLDGGGYFLMTEFLEASRTLADRWSAEDPPPDDARSLDALRPAFALLGRLHAAGLVQTDPHPGNFLECAGRLFFIDGDGVERLRDGKQALDNLALLFAQLPLAWESRADALLAAYAPERARLRFDRETLLEAVERARTRRLAHFLGKTLRDCSQFAVRRTARLFSSVVREEDEALRALIDAPDAAIARGHPLKDGNTCTVARVEVEGRSLVVKRYNLKGLAHALSRCWRPSRAWRAWLAGHRLAFHGIPTPAPLALIEERAGPLRRRAFLITGFCPGNDLTRHLSPGREPDADEAAAITALFERLFRLKITHGDMKATNFLWHDRRLVLIDLDAMIQHRSGATFARGWRRDRARFLRNWPADSALHRWLDAHLPKIE